MTEKGELIFSYTRAEAIADGVLIDATTTAKEAGFVIPVAVTRAVWCKYVEVPDGIEGQDEAGRLWDVLWMLRFAIKGANVSQTVVSYSLHVRNDNRPGVNVKSKACGR